MSAKAKIIITASMLSVVVIGLVIYGNSTQHNVQRQRTEKEQVQKNEQAKQQAINEIKANRQKDLDDCIAKVNQIKANETAKFPSDVSAEVYYGRLAAVDRATETAIKDCERVNDVNAPLPAELQ